MFYVLMCVSEVSPPRRVSVDAVGLENMTVCWWPSLDEEVDEYYIQLHPQTNQAQTREFWVNGSTCISLTQLKSGGTYEVGVAAVKGRNMSVVTTIQQTLSMFHFCFYLPFPPRCLFFSLQNVFLILLSEPDCIQLAVPYKVGTHSVELFVQMPRNSIYDGITITYQNNRSWMPVSKDSTKLLVDILSPGTQYDFNVFVTSRNTSSEGFALPPVRTCEKTFKKLLLLLLKKYNTGQMSEIFWKVFEKCLLFSPSLHVFDQKYS